MKSFDSLDKRKQIVFTELLFTYFFLGLVVEEGLHFLNYTQFSSNRSTCDFPVCTSHGITSQFNPQRRLAESK